MLARLICTEATSAASEKVNCFFLWSNSQQQDHFSHSQLNLLLRNGFAERR
jgi:hypothetical protein